MTPRFGPYEAHPAAALFPMLKGEEFNALVEDIRQNGLLEPIKILQGTNQILDGRNRYRASVDAGITPAVVSIAVDSPYSYVISRNLHRRHLDLHQRAEIAAKAKDAIAADIKRVEGERKAKQRGTGPGFATNVIQTPVSESSAHERQAATQAGKLTDVSKTTVDNVELIMKTDPERWERVRSNKEPIRPVAEEIRRAGRKQTHVKEPTQSKPTEEDESPKLNAKAVNSLLRKFEMLYKWAWDSGTDTPDILREFSRRLSKYTDEVEGLIEVLEQKKKFDPPFSSEGESS